MEFFSGITNMFSEVLAGDFFMTFLTLCARFIDINKGYNMKSFISHVYIATVTTYAVTWYAMGSAWAPLQLLLSRRFRGFVVVRAGDFALRCGIVDYLESEFGKFEERNKELFSPCTWAKMYLGYVVFLALYAALSHYTAAEVWAIDVYNFAIRF